jgi:hypothetical protein
MEWWAMTDRVYISGPMTGIKDHNFPAFFEAAADLRTMGFSVINPAEINHIGKPYNDCLKEDIKALCDCDVIALLPGWEHSNGAHLELHIAHRIGIKIVTYGELLVSGKRAVPCGKEGDPRDAEIARLNAEVVRMRELLHDSYEA